MRRHLLPRRFDPTGLYPDRIHERARAFRLLVHAEFESYIEDRVVEVADRSYRSWQATRVIRPCLIGLLAFDDAKRESPTSLLMPPRQNPAPDLSARLHRAKNTLTTYARSQNHGVRERNLLKLLLPLGVEEGKIDMTWLASIDSWAAQRGDFAHQSGTKLTVKADPRDEYQGVQQLLIGFADIDEILGEL
ncbi:MAG TPA: HEPN domain-containing protein [Kribbella sp.]|uniref:HEPN domain-containing protein n=1 Tax=Kribbella sp. TaxID=1871183 RepID=UPI002D768D98|nr:HEPN domain-containing protein [Kribbella sp.]HET6293297.1 HEPN domain-containing protein [Kribbella sp.]